jgi:hypothetical protein
LQGDHAGLFSQRRRKPARSAFAGDGVVRDLVA